VRFRELAAAARDHAARRVALYQQLAHIVLPQHAGPPPAGNGEPVRNEKPAAPAGTRH
jgi:hypothetical protein